jgi:hypothetical protein
MPTSSAQSAHRQRVTWSCGLIGLFCWLACVLPATTARGGDSARPALYVFLHTEMKSAALGRLLQQKLPTLAVTVFGRYQDFEEALGLSRPEAVLALGPLLSSQNLPIQLQGARGGQDREPYVLVSKGEFAGPLTGKGIGTLDFLGHEGTRTFVTTLLKTPELRLKRVTKAEDLLPLLQFAAVDAILIPAVWVKQLTARSRMDLRVQSLPGADVGLPGVAILNAGFAEETIARLMALDPDTKRAVGIDEWRKQ